MTSEGKIRIIGDDKLPPGVAVILPPSGEVMQFLPSERVNFLKVEALAAGMRELTRRIEKTVWTVPGLNLRFARPPAVQRPRLPGSADAATRRLYTAQRHVYRRALRRQRRHSVPRFSSYQRFKELYLPNTVIHRRPDSSLEAQLAAWRPGAVFAQLSEVDRLPLAGFREQQRSRWFKFEAPTD